MIWEQTPPPLLTEVLVPSLDMTTLWGYKLFPPLLRGILLQFLDMTRIWCYNPRGVTPQPSGSYFQDRKIVSMRSDPLKILEPGNLRIFDIINDLNSLFSAVVHNLASVIDSRGDPVLSDAAFDSVNRNRLLLKLEATGIWGNALPLGPRATIFRWRVVQGSVDFRGKGKHGATRYVRVPAINSPHAHSVRCCSQTIYLGVTESRNDTTWPDTGWSQQNQQIPQPAAAKAATGIGLLPLNNSVVEIN
ncbi:hypothetical protein J6590_028317 [Homalodisca vitripennis]|nr:hypothetical protein J6590_028317 [Homalodisca vitripennis]